MSATGEGRQPSEEELRAAYEEQLKSLRVEHIVLDNVVMLINLGMRRTGLAPGTADERDPAQVRLAIEAVRALMPQLEAIAPGEVAQIRAALSQLQLAYVRIGGQAPTEAGGEPAPGTPAGEPGPGSATGEPAPGSAPGERAPGSASGEPAAGRGPGEDSGQPAPEESPTAPGGPGLGQRGPAGPGPAQRSGRLWVPGQ